MVWRLYQPADGYIYKYTADVVENRLGLRQESKLPLAKDALNAYMLWDERVGNKLLIWRPALYLYLTLFAVAVAAVRRANPLITTLALVPLLNSLVLLAVIPVQDFRYQYGVYLIGLVAPALLFAQRENEL
jgi:hypothetical protein